MSDARSIADTRLAKGEITPEQHASIVGSLGVASKQSTHASADNQQVPPANMTGAIQQAGDAKKGKLHWIFWILGIAVFVGGIQSCQSQQLQEGFEQGADEAWQQCIAKGWPKSSCDCVISETRSALNRQSASEASNMTQAEIEAVNRQVKRSCGVY